MAHMIPVDTVKKLLRYDKETGNLFWRRRDRSFFSDDRQHKIWNTRFAGKEAFTADSGKGYKVGAIMGKRFFAHRVAWAIHNGAWPQDQIDHINGNRSDNRFFNLRPATIAQNLRNRTGDLVSTSKFKGVSWHSSRGKWRAVISGDGKYTHLGRFDSEEEAARAYDRAAAEHFGDYAKLNFPS
jgi:hypothetical protein